MKFTVNRETVVVTNCSIEFDKKAMKKIIQLLLSEGGADLSDVSTPAEFIKAIEQHRLEFVVFDLIRNYFERHQIHDTYKDGEEYFVSLD